MMAKKLGFTVNIDKCIGCSACEMACKNFNELEPSMRWRKLQTIKEDAFGTPTRMSMSLACNHCDDPACLKVCPKSAYTKRDDGIVIQDHEKCIGCKMCIEACPYKVPQYSEEEKKTSKCHMCYERLDKGELPGCVQTCPVGAIKVEDVSTLTDAKYKKEMVGFPDISKTHPATRFVKESKIERVIPS